MSHEMIALLWSYLFVGLVVAVGESARRFGLSLGVSRKIIHVGVGLWIFGTLALFRDPYMAAIPPATSAVANLVIHRKRLLKSVEAAPENLGTVYFPISFALLILLAWHSPATVAGGVMAMTIGDATAALVGESVGRRKYQTVGGRTKSLEGSLAMFLAAFAALLVTIPLAGHLAGAARLFSLPLLLAAAGLGATVATCTEALGIKGLDNLWVPLGTGAALYLALEVLTPAKATALGIGAVLALVIGLAAWLKGSLTPSGVLGAVLTGTLLFGLGGWVGGLALVGFFISSSVLSHLFRARKAEVEADYAKTGTRDLAQALANGGVAAAAALAYGVTGQAGWLGAALGALAAANADTWATELGVLSRRPPRLITTLKAAAPGTSGAVSAAGTLAALAGAAFVGAVAAIPDSAWWARLPWVALAGLAGAVFDSLLGATVQGVYYCPHCRKETERSIHRCGTPARLHRGAAWLGNDLVNLLATLVGGGLGFLLIR